MLPAHFLDHNTGMNLQAFAFRVCAINTTDAHGLQELKSSRPVGHTYTIGAAKQCAFTVKNVRLQEHSYSLPISPFLQHTLRKCAKEHIVGTCVVDN